MRKYIFILGQATDLAKQEIITILNPANIKISGSNFMIADSNHNSKELMSILGGTVKIARFTDELSNLSKLTPAKWQTYINPLIKKGQKNNLGFSIYNSPRSDYQKVKKVALTLKKELKNKKYKVRVVSSRAMALSSVIVSKNKLLNSELVIIKHNNKFIMGITEAVQDFARYGWRDIKRPWRDMRSGMLPPKVAQMMINLSGPNRQKIILDPFCGSGTILQEAILLNFSQIYGTDISQKAVDDAIENINWLKKTLHINKQVNIQQIDVKNLCKNFKAGSIDLIVTEPFMGDAQFIQRQNNIDSLENIKMALQKLYSTTFSEFKKILKNNGKVIFIFPIFNINGKKMHTLNKKTISQLGFVWQKPKIKSGKLSNNGNIIYTRPKQKVQREITVWTKK